MRLAGVIVNPAREREAEREHQRYQARGRTAVITGLVVFAVAAALLVAVVVPGAIATLDGAPPTAFQLNVAALGGAAIVGLLTWWLVAQGGERRWRRLNADRDLVRPTYVFLDEHGPLPELSDADLWTELVENDRIAGLRTAQRDLLAAPNRTPEQQRRADDLDAEILAAQTAQHARLRR
ncbi:hypothetical protein [Microbacterium sp. CFBP9034]|uniref:hypothetical protein n=1 Tax=Microbacterium sp. CFBP9034 TaxID=3096540 RepID=UPI002A6A1379|nr:hypothetical protein [Microbacterium sp. CFBP9034]MDY0910063.1 hypothetical protein [Microbacterium sp. CFBP9034]